jgi:hypothetical protein
VNKTLAATCLALVLSLPGDAGGQTPAPGSPAKTPAPGSSASASSASATGQVTVSGCLEPGPSNGPYRLTHAMPAGAANKGIADPQLKTDASKKEAGATGTTKEGAMPADSRLSYELVGAAGDLKPHVGHRIEVTGSVSKADLEMMDRVMKDRAMKDRKQPESTKVDGTPPQTEQSTQADQKMPESAIKPVKLNVTSLKHVSPTCP